jgi:peptidylprolyl isomerase
MTKLLVLALAGGLLLGTACSSDDNSSSKNATPSTPSNAASPSTGGVKPATATGAATKAAPATPAAPAATEALSDGNAPGIPPLQGEIKTDGQLRYIDQVVGTGASPTKGQHVQVHYTGWLTNGKKFDSSVDRGQPFDFVIGMGNVISGWDTGVATMKIGGKRRLIIPSALGYGARGAGTSIPPNSALIFDVELLSVGP